MKIILEIVILLNYVAANPFKYANCPSGMTNQCTSADQEGIEINS